MPNIRQLQTEAFSAKSFPQKELVKGGAFCQSCGMINFSFRQSGLLRGGRDRFNSRRLHASPRGFAWQPTS